MNQMLEKLAKIFMLTVLGGFAVAVLIAGAARLLDAFAGPLDLVRLLHDGYILFLAVVFILVPIVAVMFGGAK